MTSPPPSGSYGDDPPNPGRDGASPPSGQSGQPPPPEEQPPYGGPPSGQPYGRPYGQDPYGAKPEYGGTDGGRGGSPTLGGPARRLIARFVDTVIVAIIAGLISWPITGNDYDDATFGSQFTSGLVFALVYFVYEGFQLDRFGRTLGKRLVGLRVVRVADGGPIGGSIAWTRAGVFTLPPIVPCLGTLFWLVNVLWQFWDQPWHQCLHDKAARTTVIQDK